MIDRSLEQAMRTRWAAPVLVVLTLLAMLVHEGAYQAIREARTQAWNVSDARVAATETVSALSTLEAAARGYLATGDAQDRERFDKARDDLRQKREKTLALVARIDSPGAARSIEAIRDHLDAHEQRLLDWVALGERGGTSASNSEESRAGINGLEQAFTRLLDDAASASGRARAWVSDAVLFNRLAVHGLLLVSLAALLLFARQVRRADAERAQEQERLERQIRERTGDLRDLAGYLVSAREDERARLARELHDEMGGLFTAMKLELARLRRVPGVPPLAHERVASVQTRLNEGIALKRRIIENLRPSSLDQLGLVSALERLCEDTASVSGLAIESRFEPVTLDEDAELTVYRVVQEALTNVCKYAAAQRVQVLLAQAGEHARVEVRDDGRGFDAARVAAGRHGLLGMRVRVEARGGRLQVHSAPGAGTRIVAELPLSEAAAAGAPLTAATGDASARPGPAAGPDRRPERRTA